jgi:hypothetical protein
MSTFGTPLVHLVRTRLQKRQWTSAFGTHMDRRAGFLARQRMRSYGTPMDHLVVWDHRRDSGRALLELLWITFL